MLEVNYLLVLVLPDLFLQVVFELDQSLEIEHKILLDLHGLRLFIHIGLTDGKLHQKLESQLKKNSLNMVLAVC